MKVYIRNIIVVLIVLISIIKCIETVEASSEMEQLPYYVTSTRIVGGDTLSQLSKDWYESESFDNELRWKDYKSYMNEVVKINKLLNVDRITAGHYLAMPYYIE